MINSADKEKFRKDLFNIAMTTLSSKIVQQGREMFADLCVDAVLRLKVRVERLSLGLKRASSGKVR